MATGWLHPVNFIFKNVEITSNIQVIHAQLGVCVGAGKALIFIVVIIKLQISYKNGK